MGIVRACAGSGCVGSDAMFWEERVVDVVEPAAPPLPLPPTAVEAEAGEAVEAVEAELELLAIC